MILTFAVGPYCTGGGENHATVTITGGPKSVSLRVSRRSVREFDANDFPAFGRVFLGLLAETLPAGEVTKAKLAALDGKTFKIDVSELV